MTLNASLTLPPRRVWQPPQSFLDRPPAPALKL